MKRFLLLIVLAFGLNLNAQIERHTFMSGGSMSLDGHKYSGSPNNSMNFTFNPIGGYFVIKNLAIGVGYKYQHYGSSFHSNAISPFARYYFKNIFFQTSYYYYKAEYSSSSSLGFDLGYAIFFNKNVALEPALYLNKSLKADDFAYGFKLGLQVYFNRK